MLMHTMHTCQIIAKQANCASSMARLKSCQHVDADEFSPHFLSGPSIHHHHSLELTPELAQVWYWATTRRGCGRTTERRCRSSSTRPPSIFPTQGRSTSSRSPPATPSRSSRGQWHSTTPGYETPSCKTDLSIHTQSVLALQRAGGRNIADKAWTAALVG